MLCICATPEHRETMCKRYRTLRRQGKSNCWTQSKARDAPGAKSRHSRRRRSTHVQPWTRADGNSRTRPLHIPSDEREGHYHESYRDASEQLHEHTSNSIGFHGQFNERSGITGTHHQPSYEKRNELIISAKQFKDGYSYIAPTKTYRPSYLEQFWICGSR